jgi:ABC-type multidrug transport system fused ATPase/permease subunit
MNADRIVVLLKGKVVQEGPYRTLIEQEGTFADLAKRQLT